VFAGFTVTVVFFKWPCDTQFRVSFDKSTVTVTVAQVLKIEQAEKDHDHSG